MRIEISKSEFFAKYGDVGVTFARYYKYQFSYSAELPDGRSLVVYFGGDSGEIYRHEVVGGLEEKVRALNPSLGEVYDGKNIVERFCD